MSNTARVQPLSQVAPEELARLRSQLLPPYKVILFNDDHNEMDYVVEVLLRLINHLTSSEAVEIMMTAHITGSAVVVVCPREAAEYYQERLLSCGLTAAIEPE